MRLIRFAAPSLILLILFVSESHSYLKRQGCEILGNDSKKILLRGIGLGGWLVPEGYQLHIPGFGSPSSIQKMIVDLIGQENADQFYQRYRSNYVTEEDIRQIASWGFNSIRLPFNYRLSIPQVFETVEVLTDNTTFGRR